MSLNPEEKARSGRELHANRKLVALDDQALCTALGWSPEQLQVNLNVAPSSDPADVWRLRDFLEQIIRDAGSEPVPFTVMTEAKRSAAQGWFGHWTVPPTPR